MVKITSASRSDGRIKKLMENLYGGRSETVMNKGDLNGWKGIMNIDCPNDGYG
jgi:hypothetical protein